MSAQPTISPWPEPPAASVLFLIDARNRVEERLLRRWIESTGDASGAVITNSVVLPIQFGKKGRLVTGKLPAALDSSGDPQVVPVRIVWLPAKSARESGPRFRDLFFGDPHHPGRITAWLISRRKPHRVRRICGASASLSELRQRFSALRTADEAETNDNLAGFIIRQAGVALDIAERQLQGSRYKVPRYVAESLRASPKYRRAMRELAGELGRPVEELHEEAATYLKEMIAEPRPFFIDWAGKITRSIISLAYGKEIVCSPEGVERTREVLRDHPAALLWTHKSHIDGMALMSVMYDNDLPTPHSFGGINMAFAGAGSLGRRSGIIYIRRTFQDNPVYKLVFRQYLGYLMEKRFPFSWAFEGTRSRVGKLMPPRYGLFKYILEAAYATGASDLHFIPVSISYDLIGEAPDYAREQAGQKKRPESLAWFLGYLRKLRAPMGRVYLDFAEPVVIEGPAPEPEQVDMPKLAFEIAVRVNRITPVTFPAVACIVLLSAAPRAITIEEFRHNTIELVRWLRRRRIRLTDSFDEGHDQQLNELAQLALDRGLLSEYKEGPDAVYGIGEDQYAIAGYYRNTIVHYFVIKAILELALARAAEAPADERHDTFRAEADRLRDLFKFEFFYSRKKEFHRQIDRELKRYMSDPVAVFDGDTGQLWQTIAGLEPLLAHATLLPFVEAYMIVAEVLARLEPGSGIEEKECVGAALKFGQQSLLQRRISSRASIAKVMFTNGYRLFRNMGLTQGGDPATAARREAMSREFAAISHRLTRIQNLAHSAFSNHSAHRPEPGPVQDPGG